MAGSPWPRDGRIHLWQIDTSALRHRAATALRLLSPDEQARAAQLRRTDKDRSFVTARAALRSLLAAYLNVTPQSLSFTYGPWGRPALADGFAEGGQALSFSLSRTAGFALCAVAREMPLGVDLEALRPLPDLESLAQQTLQPAEREALQSLAIAARAKAFLRCWTQKEALIKAEGYALGKDLATLEVVLSPSAPPQIVRWPRYRGSLSDFELLDLVLPSGYIGTLAVHGRSAGIESLHFPVEGAFEANRAAEYLQMSGGAAPTR